VPWELYREHIDFSLPLAALGLGKTWEHKEALSTGPNPLAISHKDALLKRPLLQAFCNGPFLFWLLVLLLISILVGEQVHCKGPLLERPHPTDAHCSRHPQPPRITTTTTTALLYTEQPHRPGVCISVALVCFPHHWWRAPGVTASTDCATTPRCGLCWPSSAHRSAQSWQGFSAVSPSHRKNKTLYSS
jgi:hypothetical protein